MKQTIQKIFHLLGDTVGAACIFGIGIAIWYAGAAAGLQ